MTKRGQRLSRLGALVTEAQGPGPWVVGSQEVDWVPAKVDPPTPVPVWVFDSNHEPKGQADEARGF